MGDLKLKTIKSDFAILDVKAGRKALAKHFESRPLIGPCPEPMRVYVKIEGYIDAIWSGDDTVSQEFSVDVQNVQIVRKRGKWMKP
jgi:hypothetical protein